jgi:chemotaxis protein MotB
LSSSLNRYRTEKTFGLTREQNRLILHLPDKVLFDSGSAAVNPQGMEVLRKVGEILKSQLAHLMIQIGGHTDNVPVGTARAGQFSSNWDLSAARAVNVVRFLEAEVGIDPSRMSAVGFGEHRPVASNETEAGRALNRRIEIVLLEP